MKTLLERFESKVKLPNNSQECWEWVGSTTRGGYGQLRYKKDGVWTMRRAHCAAYELLIGTIPKGLFVCHICDTPKCVNPNHLFLGTPKDNVDDREKKGRSKWGRKEGQNWLSFNIAKEIRKVREANPSLSCKKIGVLFNTSNTQVYRIITNQIWESPEGGLEN